MRAARREERQKGAPEGPDADLDPGRGSAEPSSAPGLDPTDQETM
jgi:hypothetical protein